MDAQTPPLITTDTGTPSREWARQTADAFGVSDVSFDSPTTKSPSTSTPVFPAKLGSGHAVQPQTGDLSISAAKDAQKGPFDAKLVAVPETQVQVPGAYPETPLDEPPSVAQTAQLSAGESQTRKYS